VIAISVTLFAEWKLSLDCRRPYNRGVTAQSVQSKLQVGWPRNLGSTPDRHTDFSPLQRALASCGANPALYSIRIRVVSHYTARHDTTRRDRTRHGEILFYGFHMLALALVRYRQLTTKTVSLGLREEKILPLYACHCMSCCAVSCRIMWVDPYPYMTNVLTTVVILKIRSNPVITTSVYATSRL
jgi:hypothetical protein